MSVRRGRVSKAIKVKEGQAVKEGDVLFEVVPVFTRQSGTPRWPRETSLNLS